MKITQAIAAEHATLLTWFDELEAVLPRLTSQADVNALASLVAAVLGHHADLETEFAFLPLDRSLRRAGHLPKHVREHQEISRQLGEVRRAATCAGACRRLRAALRASRKHFSEEEESLFPVIEQALTPQALEMLGARFNATRQSKTKLTDRPGERPQAEPAAVDAAAPPEKATPDVAPEADPLDIHLVDSRPKDVPAARSPEPSRTVVFRITAPAARRVWLLGDFTQWVKHCIPLQRMGDGVWAATVELTPGRHAYRFLVDGKWHDDPECNLRVPNAFRDQDISSSPRNDPSAAHPPRATP